jgi:hypothetical protein
MTLKKVMSLPCSPTLFIKNARVELESKTGKSVVTGENFLTLGWPRGGWRSGGGKLNFETAEALYNSRTSLIFLIISWKFSKLKSLEKVVLLATRFAKTVFE